ncbi:hypothetical protein K432DRAFT_393456 [Lepidopterella palustris CBS 459.81]|uniref:DUF6590 domain-containing protein n=1 Tax=Lepidopterella palustris CBS 459.81 TaxID=1314670 RepID=A0A8E2JES2_9PEZI|nr:hypothetical protein K432DRAFT_393456 [Lepidopterella palustris CBS 459.81]
MANNNANIQWTWSEAYGKYYHVTYENDFSRRRDSVHYPPSTAGNTSTWIPAQADANNGQYQNSPSLQPPQAGTVYDYIKGTPGQYEKLDPSFSRGEDEPAGETAPKHDNDNVTTVKFGGRVFTQIRRFVVVQERQGFCYACPIFTYNERGTLKQGCKASEHAIVYLVGSTPTLLEGETGITKKPIGIVPIDSTVQMHIASRIRFGKVYPIEWNVKVKDLGSVSRGDMENLWTYFCNERD